MNRLFDNYDEFVDKFKAKKTADDCYTPDNVFNAILEWAVKRWGIDRDKIVRPFYPGGDYEHYKYDAGCIVFDNPPFSFITQIVRFYEARKIKYFLFCPTLTILGLANIGKCSIVINDYTITYHNGAKVNTSFVTNIVSNRIIVSNDLYQAIVGAQPKRKSTKYSYPKNVVTIANMTSLSRAGCNFVLDKSKCLYIKELHPNNGSHIKMWGGVFGGRCHCKLCA